MIPFPEKKYQVIYADPPWKYASNGRESAINHYQTMTTEELCNLPVAEIAGRGACLFLWATFPTIPEALRVIEAWGFTYKGSAFVWVKTYAKSGKRFWGMGQYTRANAEVCLLGVSKEFRASERVKSHRVHQIVEAPFAGHSRKPPEVRDRIVELLGDVPCIELFSRERATGWDAWGNEI